MVNKLKQKKKKKTRNCKKRNKKLNALIEKKQITEVRQKQEKEENRQRLHSFQEIQISYDESKKSVSSLAESGESGEISASTSEWKMGPDELFVTCLNHDSKSKIKPIKNYLDLFINTSLYYMAIRSCLVSQPNNKLILNKWAIFHCHGFITYCFRCNFTSKSTW